MPVLPNVHVTIECHLDARVPIGRDTRVGVPDVRGGDGRVVADLLGDDGCGAAVLGPGGGVDLAKEGVEGFFYPRVGVAVDVELGAEGGEEEFEDEEGAGRGVGGVGRGGEGKWAGRPGGGDLGDGFGGEEERGDGDVGEVAFNAGEEGEQGSQHAGVWGVGGGGHCCSGVLDGLM